MAGRREKKVILRDFNTNTINITRRGGAAIVGTSNSDHGQILFYQSDNGNDKITVHLADET